MKKNEKEWKEKNGEDLKNEYEYRPKKITKRRKIMIKIVSVDTKK